MKPASISPLVSLTNLRVHFEHEEETVTAVDGVNLKIPRGKTVCIVGESGCGKTTLALSILRLLSPPGKIVSGKIVLHQSNGESILTEMTEDSEAIRRIRGNRIAMIFQEPLTSLSPVHTVGSQILEAIRLHRKLPQREARTEVLRIMERVGIPNSGQRFRQYPHELSGGLRQRVMIAMALCCQPDLLIADEPTSALDVCIQAQILDLLRDLQKEFGMSILLITHDLGIVAEMADDVAVMHKGRIVEQAKTPQILSNPQHSYTQSLLQSYRSLTGVPPESATPGRAVAAPALPLLRVRNLQKHFPVKQGIFRRTVRQLKAVDEVSFNLYKGECLGLVGESGSGKTTLARTILRAMKPTGGTIEFHPQGEFYDLAEANSRNLRKLRRHLQMVFQDPYSSLNPRMTVSEIVGEPLLVHGMKKRAEREKRVRDLLKQVGLLPQHLNRYPHAFSGGQRQRIAIARALALQPCLIVADEAVSSLDVSVQAQILDLLQHLQRQHQLSLLFIAHDLRVVRQICDRVAVMYRGKIVELAETEQIFSNPQHPYTQSLLAALPQSVPPKSST